MFAGYRGRPEATAEAFDAAGWFRTGDLGRLDEDGYLAIVGRAKELIISGGYNVYPREVEDVLRRHPAVADAAVVATALESLRPAGRVLLFAQTRMGDALALDAGQVCALEKAVLGSYSADIDLQQKAAELIFRRQVRVESLITHRFPLPEIEAALSVASRPREGSLKVVVQP